MDNTRRVAQWRQRMRDEGKEALTVWLSHEAKLRLEDLASVWHATTSEWSRRRSRTSALETRPYR